MTRRKVGRRIARVELSPAGFISHKERALTRIVDYPLSYDGLRYRDAIGGKTSWVIFDSGQVWHVALNHLAATSSALNDL